MPNTRYAPSLIPSCRAARDEMFGMRVTPLGERRRWLGDDGSPAGRLLVTWPSGRVEVGGLLRCPNLRSSELAGPLRDIHRERMSNLGTVHGDFAPDAHSTGAERRLRSRRPSIGCRYLGHLQSNH